MNPMHKFAYVEEFLKHAKLQDHDVIVMQDTDTVLSGYNYLPKLEEFLATTARSPAEMDVRKIRAQQMRPPFYMSTEENCWLGSTMTGDKCREVMAAFEVLREQWVTRHNSECNEVPWDWEPNAQFMRNKKMGPNSGSIVARVWAFKEVIRGFHIITQSRFPLRRNIFEWDCDQTVIGGMTLELMKWELSSGLLDSLVCEQREGGEHPKPFDLTPYQLTPGVMGFDFQQDFTTSMIDLEHGVMNGEEFTERSLRYTVKRVLDSQLAALKRSRKKSPGSSLDGGHAGSAHNDVLLAPVFITGTTRSNNGKYYKGLGLNGSMGHIDISVPYPDGVPLGYHYNGGAKLLMYRYLRVIPWMVPLYAEGRLPHPTDPISPSSRPQLAALMSLMANAPPFRVWGPSGRTPLLRLFEAELSNTVEQVSIGDICRLHNPKDLLL
eukprot:gene11553-biopygen8376